MNNRVIVDTSAIYALISASDSFHEKARRTYEHLLDRNAELYTTSYILVETSALVHHRLGFHLLKAFVESIQGIFSTYWIDRAIHIEAWRSMVEREGQRLSLVDWTTIVVAKKLNASVFAFDEDFRQEALVVLPRM